MTVSQEICDRFGLGRIVCVRAAGGTRNANFIVETDRGRWVVRRRYEGYCDPERIEFDHSAAAFLREGGAAVIPPVTAGDGGSYWRGAEGVWEAYPFADGEHLREGARKDVLALADALARLHDAGKSFALRYDKLGPRGETDPDHLLESAARIRGESPETGDGPGQVREALGDALAPYEEAVRHAADRLPLSAWTLLPHTLVHGDVQPANVLVHEGSVSAFFDLDWLAWRPRIYDLCFAVLCCCASHEEPIGQGDVWSLTQTPELDRDLVGEFLDAYGRASTPLSEEERCAVRGQLMLTWCHIRIDNALKVPAEDRRRFLMRGGDSAFSQIGNMGGVM